MVSCCARTAILHSRMDLGVDAVRSVLGARGADLRLLRGLGDRPLLNTHEDAADPGRESRAPSITRPRCAPGRRGLARGGGGVRRGLLIAARVERPGLAAPPAVAR